MGGREVPSPLLLINTWGLWKIWPRGRLHEWESCFEPPPAAAQGKAGPAHGQHKRPNPVGGGMGELASCEDGKSIPITYLSCGGMGWKEMLSPILSSPNPPTPIHPSTLRQMEELALRSWKGEGLFLPLISCSTWESDPYNMPGQYSRADPERVRVGEL